MEPSCSKTPSEPVTIMGETDQQLLKMLESGGSSSSDDEGEEKRVAEPTPYEYLQHLLEVIINITRHAHKLRTCVDFAAKIMRQAQKAALGTHSTGEMLLEAQILYIGSKVLKEDMEAFSVNLVPFNIREYENGLLQYVQTLSSNRETNWSALAPIFSPQFQGAPAIRYLLGSFKLENIEPKARNKGVRQKSRSEPEKLVIVGVQDEDGSTGEDPVSDSDYVYKCLMHCYHENRNRPINYLKFVINPDSLWETIKNVFNCSILVHDHLVKMVLDSKNIPHIEPILEKETERKSNKMKTKQFIFRLSKKEWLKCIEKYRITRTMIPEQESN